MALPAMQSVGCCQGLFCSKWLPQLHNQFVSPIHTRCVYTLHLLYFSHISPLSFAYLHDRIWFESASASLKYQGSTFANHATARCGSVILKNMRKKFHHPWHHAMECLGVLYMYITCVHIRSLQYVYIYIYTVNININIYIYYTCIYM